jgi:hypothetical protein
MEIRLEIEVKVMRYVSGFIISANSKDWPTKILILSWETIHISQVGEKMKFYWFYRQQPKPAQKDHDEDMSSTFKERENNLFRFWFVSGIQGSVIIQGAV